MFLLKKDRQPGSALPKLMICIALIFIFSCKEKHEPRQIEPAFYYWKSVLHVSSFEKQKLDSLKVKTIYVKFFDVNWDEAGHKPVPVAKLQASGEQLHGGISIIPTIFITNACIQKIDSSQTKMLAEKIMQLLKTMIAETGFDPIPEVQVDCDWTASTRENYFDILRHLKSLKPNAKLSATIRLHQVKYRNKTGVPPVDRGLLMCYNMGNLKDPATKNSIIETAELKKYIGRLSDYPLELDLAFPLFDWKVLYRHNRYSGLFQDLPASFFNYSFASKTGNRYLVTKDTLLRGYDLRKGDMIRDEQSDIREVLAAAAEVSKHIRNTRLRVSLYHMDSVILSKYATHELESIYNSLH